MANPRKPTTLKAIAGTARPDREPEGGVELPLVDAPPDPPDWLPNSHAVKEWNRLVPILMANKLLTEAALGPLAHLCALHGKIVQLYAAGEAPTASMSGTLRNLQNDFGLTPVAQGKVKATGDVPAGNKFATNGKRATG
jgi:phage terminase small subunit